MKDTKINGYLIVANAYVARAREYVIMGHRLTGFTVEDGTPEHEYVIAWVPNLAVTAWGSGYYTTNPISAAEDFKSRVGA